MPPSSAPSNRLARALLHWGLALTFNMVAALPGLAQDRGPRDLTQASLEDLMNMQVTSVSKREQSLSKTGAAVFVITQEDIRKSGAANIPDLLRMAPGVNVARIDSNTWAISIRGFNTRYSDKVLVLIDGRSVYMSSFSGVYWDQQDVPLEDIERIEVIRGPGGTVWGANAVNGVINIITKHSKDTQGGLISAGTGSKESIQGLLQYGGKIGSKGTYRAFSRYFKTEASALDTGARGADGWNAAHGGFRSDWSLSPRDTLMAEGNLFHTREGQTLTLVRSDRLPNVDTFNDRINVDSGDIVGRWDHTFQNGSDASTQVYFDHLNRFDHVGIELSSNADVTFQHHLALGARQDFMWGTEYRRSYDSISPGYATTMTPVQKTDDLFSTFFQDEIRLAPSVSLTLGSKFEHNAYSGFEYEPSGQLVWTPTGRHTVWASAAQAIRQPSRLDAGISYDGLIVPMGGGAFGVVKVLGNPNGQAEQMRDYEAGYRAQIGRRLSVDVAAFWSFYRHLQSAEPGTPYFTLTPGPPHLVIPRFLDNTFHAQTDGVEVFANWNVTNRWRISPGLSIIQMNVTGDPSNPAATAVSDASATPTHQFELRSSFNLAHHLDWDTSVYFVGLLSSGSVPSYTRVDTRLGWRLGESVELSVAGQNLLTPRHLEFGSFLGVDHTEIERSVVAKVTWRF